MAFEEKGERIENAEQEWNSDKEVDMDLRIALLRRRLR